MNTKVPEEMRALVLNGNGYEHLEICKVPTPKPNENQILAHVDAVNLIDPSFYITRIDDLNHAIEFLKFVKEKKIDGKAIVYPHMHSTEIKIVNKWSTEDELKYLNSSIGKV